MIWEFFTSLVVTRCTRNRAKNHIWAAKFEQKGLWWELKSQWEVGEAHWVMMVNWIPHCGTQHGLANLAAASRHQWWSQSWWWAFVSPSQRFCVLLLWLLQMLADLVLPALMLCVCSRSSKSECVGNHWSMSYYVSSSFAATLRDKI